LRLWERGARTGVALAREVAIELSLYGTEEEFCAAGDAATRITTPTGSAECAERLWLGARLRRARRWEVRVCRSRWRFRRRRLPGRLRDNLFRHNLVPYIPLLHNLPHLNLLHLNLLHLNLLHLNLLHQRLAGPRRSRTVMRGRARVRRVRVLWGHRFSG